MFTQWLVYHVASGRSFFSGTACLLAAVGISPRAREGWTRRTRNLLIAVGGILVVVSATPLPSAFYPLLAISTLLWLAGETRRRRASRRIVLGLRIAVAVAWSVAMLAEWPFHQRPRVSPLGHPVLGVIGDSVTAGIDGERVITWPRLLARDHGVVVRDHSKAGATVASALRQAEALREDERLVMLEIGGNDLLGNTTPTGFESGLENLLRVVSRPGRVVVMFELPLPPSYNEYGRAQRRVARRHEVLLVPKRVMLGVLLQDGNTLDTIHLSPGGHGQMAAAVWEIVRGAYVGG